MQRNENENPGNQSLKGRVEDGGEGRGWGDQQSYLSDKA